MLKKKKLLNFKTNYNISFNCKIINIIVQKYKKFFVKNTFKKQSKIIIKNKIVYILMKYNYSGIIWYENNPSNLKFNQNYFQSGNIIFCRKIKKYISFDEFGLFCGIYIIINEMYQYNLYLNNQKKENDIIDGIKINKFFYKFCKFNLNNCYNNNSEIFNNFIFLCYDYLNDLKFLKLCYLFFKQKKFYFKKKNSPCFYFFFELNPFLYNYIENDEFLINIFNESNIYNHNMNRVYKKKINNYNVFSTISN